MVKTQRSLNVLILDDNEDDALMMLHELRRAGYQPAGTRVETEAEFLAALDRGGFDVVLSDCALPVYDARQALESYHQRELDQPFLIVTDSLGEEQAVELLRLGARDYLLKDRLARLSAAVSAALEDKRLRDEHRALQRATFDVIQSYDATIAAWSHAMEMRGVETRGHTERVTNWTLDIARAMGIPDGEMLHIRRGAMLHDIGKLALPDSILLKSGPLSGEEFAQMHRHTQFAYDWLSPIADLQPALDIPYCHHEYWDGHGYPRGLKGEQIPLSARIFAVIDSYDALISDRPFRPAWSKQEALDYIKTMAGIRFDPQVVATFLDCLGGWGD